MTQTGHLFCPRCGNALVADMPFCPRCGLNTAEAGQGAGAPASPMDAATGAPPPAPVEAAPAAAAPSVRSFADRGPHIPGVVIAGLLVMVGLIGFGLLTRPPAAGPAPGIGTGGTGGQVQPGSTGAAAPSAPIVGLTILSPADGQAVASKDINVIGLAPPGVNVTQDISFGLDQHATADGTGHWTIKVGLKDGENKLVFRIGDDASTRKELRVTYTPPAP